jgi:hypothetical protein
MTREVPAGSRNGCHLSSTDFPHILWVSPHGTLLIADGMSTENPEIPLPVR